MKHAFLALLCGCWTGQSTASELPPKPDAGALLLERSASGGVLQLLGDRVEAMKLATFAMQQHCGVRAFTIVQQVDDRITFACTQSSGSDSR